MYCKCSIFTIIKRFFVLFFKYGNYTNYLSLPCANYLCIHPFRLYPEQQSSPYFYRKRTWNTRVKLSATVTTVCNIFFLLRCWQSSTRRHNSRVAPTCCVSRQSGRLWVCYSSYSPQKIWTGFCTCPHISVTTTTKPCLVNSSIQNLA